MKFKVLVYNQVKEPFFVDVNLLYKGIYQISKPTLYSLNTTIEEMVDNYEPFIHLTHIEDFITNLTQCEFKIYELKEVE